MGKVKFGDEKKGTFEDHANLNDSKTKIKPPIIYLKHMEEIVLRFPHIGQQIFEKLDDQCLVKCRKVQKSWKDFISNEKIACFRNIKMKTNAGVSP